LSRDRGDRDRDRDRYAREESKGMEGKGRKGVVRETREAGKDQFLCYRDRDRDRDDKDRDDRRSKSSRHKDRDSR
jgi:hypothetical protein